MEKTCPCGKEFWCSPSLIERKKYCSKKCFYEYRTIPIWNKGLKGIHLSPKTEFKKGVRNSPTTEFEKGHKPISPIKKGEHRGEKTEFTTKRVKGEQNFKWKGDEVGYFASHAWMVREYGRACLCENRENGIFEFICTQKSKSFDWAFTKKEGYKRDRSLYIQLCHSCHLRYDRQK